MRRSSRWSVLREPTVPFLLAACVVHVVRRSAVDFAVFFGTAVIIVIDAGRRPRPLAPAAPSGRARGWLVTAGMTLFAGVAAVPAPASLGARLVMIAIGLAAVAVVLCRPASSTSVSTSMPARGSTRVPSAPGAVREPDARRHGSCTPGRDVARGWPLWAVIGVGACLWELASFIEQQVWPADQADHPAASDLIGPLLAGWGGRAVFLLLWAGAGCWLFLRFLRADASGERSEPVRRHERFDTGGDRGGTGR